MHGWGMTNLHCGCRGRLSSVELLSEWAAESNSIYKEITTIFAWLPLACVVEGVQLLVLPVKLCISLCCAPADASTVRMVSASACHLWATSGSGTFVLQTPYYRLQKQTFVQIYS